MKDIVDSNSDTRPFELSQFGSWYLLAGLEQYIENVEDECQIDTLELELDRLEQWESAHGGYYEYDHVRSRFAQIREQLAELREWVQKRDRLWYAEELREDFRVIDGGKE